MSWWKTVVDVVKDVAINAVQGSSSSSTCGIMNAGAFQSPIYARTSTVNAGNASNQSDSEDDSGEGTSQATASARITTRARITYELDRFQKNAMLIFVQNLSDGNEGCRIIDTTNEEVSELVETFTSFLFEVDIHTDLTCSQVDHKCIEFFQRDFSQYGAVAVVVLSFNGTIGEMSAKDGSYPEYVILRHLTFDLNPTLLGKPKIYITETNRTSIPTPGRYSMPLEAHHTDILGLHIPSVFTESIGNIRPLLRLCHNMKEMCDSRDFLNIVKKTVEEANETIPVFNHMPIELSNRLTRDMILARS